MLKEELIYCGYEATVVCDEVCDKAWGITSRPKIHLDEENSEDFVWLADHELGTAPIDPGTYEGGHAKPTSKEERMNKWCIRECERCTMSTLGQTGKPIEVTDFSKRVSNIS